MIVDDDVLLDDEQAAEELGVSKRTFQRLRHEGAIEYMRVSDRCVRTSKRVLAAYKAERSFRSRAAELASAA